MWQVRKSFVNPSQKFISDIYKSIITVYMWFYKFKHRTLNIYPGPSIASKQASTAHGVVVPRFLCVQVLVSKKAFPRLHNSVRVVCVYAYACLTVKIDLLAFQDKTGHIFNPIMMVNVWAWFEHWHNIVTHDAYMRKRAVRSQQQQQQQLVYWLVPRFP